MKWSRLIITFFRAIGFLLFFFCIQLKVSGEVLNVRGPTERKKKQKKKSFKNASKNNKKRIFPRIAAQGSSPDLYKNKRVYIFCL